MTELHLGNLEEGSFTGDPGICVNQGSGDGPLSAQGPWWGTWKEACTLGTLRDERWALVGHLSPRELNKGSLKGELLYW
jgi:hypothetical protein